MAQRLSWIAFGVLLVFISNEKGFSKKLHLLKKKEETAAPAKKSIIGNFNLKEYSKSIKPEDCKNFKPKGECAKLIKGNTHVCLLNRKYMADNCRLACRFCSPLNEARKKKLAKKCKDIHPKCRSWARAGDCLHYVAFMMDACKKSCEICGEDNPSVCDKDERCPKWGKTGFCGIRGSKKRMRKKCPYSCSKYASRRYIVKYAKPPKPHPPHPTHAPKPTKPTPKPTPPLSEQEKEDLKEALEEYAEEEETRLREKEEQRKQTEKVAPLQAPPVLRTKTARPSPIPAPLLSSFSPGDLNIDVPDEYDGGTPPKNDKKRTRI